MKTVRVEGANIKDWATFFDEFANAFGFPEFLVGT
jgi:RNAse (barnase) inhibitor barstar